MALGIRSAKHLSKTEQNQTTHPTIFVEHFLNLIEFVSEESSHDQATQNSRSRYWLGSRLELGQRQLCGQAQRSNPCTRSGGTRT
jgi:hypothetical protein